MLAGNLVVEREGVPFAVGGREHGFQRDGGHAQPAQGLQELGCLQGRKMGHHQHFIRKGAGVLAGPRAGSMPHRAASVSPYSEGGTGPYANLEAHGRQPDFSEGFILEVVAKSTGCRIAKNAAFHHRITGIPIVGGES